MGVGLFLLFCVGLTFGHLSHIPYSTVAEAAAGELLGARVADDQQWRFPESETISENYFKALLAYEDTHFYYHPGVNPVSLLRAVRLNHQAGRVVSGGSTITMQLARICRQNRTRSYSRKMIEICHAIGLEIRYRKKRILQLYAANAPFGGNTVGVEAAAWRYFRHSPASMSWGEAATLAVLPNSPSALHLGRNREMLAQKRNRLLDKLFSLGEIDRTTCELAKEEPLPENASPIQQMAPHLVSGLHQSAHGERVRTTIRADLQREAEQLVASWNRTFAQNNINNIAAMIVDVPTGEVLSYCANATPKKGMYSDDVDIIQSQRSTGSLLKPMLYAAMLGEGRLLPTTLLPDIPTYINGFAPKNFLQKYDGAVPADKALSRSLNVPFVKMLQEYGVDEMLILLRKMGFKSLSRPASHYGLSLILGGAESTMWELSSAYCQMAQSVIAASDSTQRILPLHTFGLSAPQSQTPPLNPGAVWQTFQALLDANRPEEIDWKLLPTGRQIAWKTGTSYGLRDGWAIGVTPKYLVAVWVGNATGEGRPGLTGGMTAARVMFDLFTLLPRTDWFNPPYTYLQEVEICPLSGYPEGGNCPEKTTILTAHTSVQLPTCPYHTTVYLSQDGHNRLYRECAEGQRLVEHKWFVLPPVQEWYYKRTSSHYQPLPPLSPRCLAMAERTTMAFIYPEAGARIHLPRQMDGSPGRVVAELAHQNPNAILYWHLDGDYIATTSLIHQQAIFATPGPHRLTVVDDTGQSIERRFSID